MKQIQMKPIQLRKIMAAVLSKLPQSEKALIQFARIEAGKLKCPPPEKSALLLAYHNLLKNGKRQVNRQIEKFLTKRAVRTLSGVAVISLLTKPSPCPGRCLFCPTENNMPKSYLANEPAVMRAILNRFDPFRQIKMRLKALKINGHDTDKIELIIMGGTWSCHPLQYQNWFIKRCYEALNGRKAKNLLAAQKQNETAKHRCIGLTLETRPDFIDETEIKRMRNFGCTRVELGIQHTDEKILKTNHRGHTARQSIKAIKLLKQAGFKINYHLMPGLYGATPAKDLAMFKKIYTHPDWMPDMVKIYPCVVTKNSALYKIWQQGKYKSYSNKQLLNLIVKIKKMTPPFVRITRLIRDIPAESIVAGNKITNLRQIIQNDAVKDGWSCQCIRCREAGHATKSRNQKNKKSNLILKTVKYKASDGMEYFLSLESKDNKVLYAFLRFRINDDANQHFIPELKNAGLIRELHTYGQMTPLGELGEIQHSGLGKKLIQKAEKICLKSGLEKIAIIAGVGVRKYYEKLGYKLEGTYMVKSLM